jgi:NAD(P)-dependent dehydrogenase (short-subunit alcohol dehydrogenase family)
MEVNFFAPLKLIQAILPSMRHRRSGLIANVSSIAGLDGIATCGLYCASKFALEGIPPPQPLASATANNPPGLSESLALELRPFNIRVLIVEPGAFRSNFLGAYITPKAGVSEAYKDTAVGRQMEVFAVWDGKQPGNVEEGCRRIFEVVTGTGMGAGLEGYLRLPLGSDWAERAEVKILHLQETRRVFEDVWRSTDYKEWGL